MSTYAAQGTQTVTATTILTLLSTATIRPRLQEYVASTTGAPNSDASYQILLKRITTAGTTTPVTPTATDPNDPAATLIAGSNATVEPTYSAGVIDNRGINPRATFRWVSYDQRSEIIMPATANNGLGFLLNLLGGASTVIIDAKVLQ